VVGNRILQFIPLSTAAPRLIPYKYIYNTMRESENTGIVPLFSLLLRIECDLAGRINPPIINY
jgi:hypothetical protein